ncbi:MULTISPECIES: hypothetical protein [Streptomyces]|uniref:Uncharacterized protein n=1 Tax=Streptomyces lonegramiae TaxID=3075524 RepID=A0ABU2X5G7_9ACTN|nr:hypothetical protein [Streptomyces sp. DSM 41529]MDT0541147.1 hypothetical protein [Streptomyces sp. DSM 41529]
MAKREDLGVVLGGRSTQQKKTAQQPGEDQVQQSQTQSATSVIDTAG